MSKMNKEQVMEKLSSLKESTTKLEAIVKDAPEGDFTKQVVDTLNMQTIILSDIVEKLHT